MRQRRRQRPRLDTPSGTCSRSECSASSHSYHILEGGRSEGDGGAMPLCDGGSGGGGDGGDLGGDWPGIILVRHRTKRIARSVSRWTGRSVAHA